MVWLRLTCGFHWVGLRPLRPATTSCPTSPHSRSGCSFRRSRQKSRRSRLTEGRGGGQGRGWSGLGTVNLDDTKPMGVNRRPPYLRRSRGSLRGRPRCDSRGCRRSHRSRRGSDGSPFHQNHRRTCAQFSTLGLDGFNSHLSSGREAIISRYESRYYANPFDDSQCCHNMI